MTEPKVKELVRLVELDYERTSKLTEGVVASISTYRGWAVTGTLALVGLAIERNAWQLSMLACVLAVLLGLADAYHAWVYSHGVAHSHRAEQTLHLYYASVARGEDDEEVTAECEDHLRAYRLGWYSTIKRFRVSYLVDIRPRFAFIVTYATLIALALASLVFIVVQDGTPGRLQCTETAGMPGMYVCVEPAE